AKDGHTKLRERLLQRLALADDLQLVVRPSNDMVAILGLTAGEASQLFWDASEGRLADLDVGAARFLVGPAPIDGHPATDPDLPPRSPAQVSPWERRPRRCSLLLVDDDPHLRQMMRHLLDHEFDVREADCADTAERAFSEGPVDLILADQRMPGRT